MPYLQANTNNPFGMQPVEGPVPAQTHAYIVSTSATAGVNANFSIMPGDVVVLTTGNFVQAAATGGLTICGTDVTSIVGVAAQSAPVTPSSQTLVLVYDDPNQVFVVQDNGNATAGMLSSAAVLGTMFQFVATATSGGQSQATGNTVRSGMTLFATLNSAASNRSLAATGTAHLPILLMAMHPIEYTPNAPTSSVIPTASGVYRKWLVKFAAHTWASSV